MPSSRFLAARMLRRVDWDGARVIVELGPGTGCVTREILRRMRPDATLVAIEINPGFGSALARSVQDSRLKVQVASALSLDAVLKDAGVDHPDHVICSLPFANMPEGARTAIVERVRDCLVPGGLFILFQYRSLLLPVLRRSFPFIRSEYEWRNLPPARVLHCHAGPHSIHAAGMS
jgi:phospholipid N-methyltransferase